MSCLPFLQNCSSWFLGVFDIFGFWPQTIQGADIISSQLNVKVIMPDFFDKRAESIPFVGLLL